jgi:outer membrane receptor for ferrienterochelin and colicins
MKVLIVLVTMTTCIFLFAQDEDMGLEQLLFQEVVTVTKTLTPVASSPANVTIITAQEIENRGYKTILDILRDVLAIDINSPGQGYQTDVGGRGVNDNLSCGKHWQVLIDGHDMTWRQFYRNNVSQAWLLVDNIKRIEVVKGPSSSLWGANAFLGVINIVTKDKTDIGQNLVTFGGGHNSVVSTNESVNMIINDRLSVFSTFSVYNDDIYRKIKEWSEIAGKDIVLGNSESRYINSYTKLEYGELSIKGMISLDYSYKAISSFSVGAKHSYFPIEKYWIEPGWEHFFLGNKIRSQILTYFDYTTWGNNAAYEDNPYAGDIVDPANPPGGSHFIRHMKASDHIYGAKLQTDITPVDELSIVSGIDYEYRDMIRWYYTEVFDYLNLEEPQFSPYQIGGYIQCSYKPVRLVALYAGARYDYHSVYEGQTSPRASIVLSPVNNLFIKGIYGRAFKAPSIHELYYFRKNAYYGNPSLTPEYTNTWEGQLVYARKKVMFNIGAFLVDMTDVIAYVRQPADQVLIGEDDFPAEQRPDGTVDYSQQMNIGHYRTQGIEAQMYVIPVEGLKLSIGGTYRKPESIEDDTTTALPYSAQYKAIFGLEYSGIEKLTCSIFGRYVGVQDVPERLFNEPGSPYSMTEDPTLEAPEYMIVDASIVIRNILKNVNVLFKVENILNEEYYDPARDVLYNQPGISTFIKVTVSF